MRTNRPTTFNSVAKPFWVWGVFTAVFCVAVLWYQFGFSLGGMIEEWDLLQAVAKDPHFWNSFPGNPMSESFAARPFQITPFFIARAIDDRSFLGFHVLLMAACFLRVLAGASIGYFLFRSRAYAAALGMLFLVFPADTQQMSFRTLNISVAVALMTCGVALTMRAIVAKNSQKRWLAITLATTASVVAVLIYEPVLALYALPALLLFARYGLRQTIAILRRRRALAGFWFVAPIVNMAYLYYAIVVAKSGYQVGVSQGGMLTSIKHNFHYLLESAAYRVFYESWVSTWEILIHGMASYGFVALLAIILLIILILWSGPTHNRIGVKRLVRFILIGLIAAVAGYMPFMVSEAHMLITQRTFMSVAPGASLILLSSIALVCSSREFPGVVIAAVFIFLGFIAQLYQFDKYNRVYTGIIRPYMSILADKTDPTKKIHLALDTSGIGGHMDGMFYSKVQNGPGVRRHEPQTQFLLCMDEKLTKYKEFSSCTLNDGVWTITTSRGTVSHYDANDVQAISVGKDFNAGYHSISSTWHDLGSYTAEKSIFLPVHAITDHYTCVADSDWGYSGFCRGSGWTDGMLSHGYFEHENVFAAISPNPSFIFTVKRAAKDYMVQIQTLGPIDPNIVANLKMSLNNTPIDFQVTSEKFIQATVPARLVIDGQNEIELENAIAPDRDFGLYVARVDFAPVGSKDLPSTEPRKTYPTVDLGQWYEFTSASANDMVVSGFSSPETDGTWTDGKIATLRFVLPEGRQSGSLVVNALPFLSESHQHVAVDFDINGKRALTKSFDAPAQWGEFTVPIAITSDANRRVTVTMTIRDPAKPGTQDQRDLGLKIKRLEVQ